MTIAVLEALSFGLARMVAAADAVGERLCLLTGDRGIYRHELATLDPAALDVVDIDTRDVAACAAALKGLPDLSGLINSTDTWALPGAELAVQFGLSGQDPEVARTVRDKSRVRNLLHGAGLSPGGAVEVDPADPGAAALVLREVGLPAVLKDTAGTSSRNVFLVHDEDGLAAALAAAGGAQFMGRLFAEPFFAGPVYSAETLTWDGKTRLLGVLSRQMSPQPSVREEAAAFPVALPAADLAAIEDWVGRVLAAVGHRGFAHVELVLTADGPQLVEVNGRIGGAMVGEALCRSLGTNVYEAMVEMALGRRPRLLDAEIGGGPGVAFALVYAREVGTLSEVRGTGDALAAYPGKPEWYPTMGVGQQVVHLADQRSCTGIVLAEGATAELALHRVLSAAGSLRPVVS